MAIFEAAIGTVLKHEGGYVNHPSDPGGETNFGISKRQYPDLDIKKLTQAQAAAIYKRDYWGRFGEIYDQDLATKVFDLSVLCGTRTTIRMLQSSVCACGHVIDIDGVLGQGTLCAVNAIPPGELLSTFRDEAVEHFTRLVKNNAKLEPFYRGWIDRATS
jgi:lysozyme family protein